MNTPVPNDDECRDRRGTASPRARFRKSIVVRLAGITLYGPGRNLVRE
jgi:hypothetical protein